MRILGIYDNHGKTVDRYTVVYDEIETSRMLRGRTIDLYSCRGMSEDPFHPQGYGQIGTAQIGEHLGTPTAFDLLPDKCKKLVLMDIDAKGGFDPLKHLVEA